MAKLPNMVIWACPECKRISVSIERDTAYRVACQCGVCGPWARTDVDAVFAWNRLSRLLLLARMKEAKYEK
jgi:transcription elongation factor Elf1